MTRKIYRQWLMAGAVLFLAAACQPQASGSSNQQQPRPAKPVEGKGASCKPAPQECVKDCPKKNCTCPQECKKECPCPQECKKECPCPKECPKKECPCPQECPKQCTEAEVKKETQTPVVQSEVPSEVKTEPTLSSSTAVEAPAP